MYLWILKQKEYFHVCWWFPHSHAGRNLMKLIKSHVDFYFILLNFVPQFIITLPFKEGTVEETGLFSGESGKGKRCRWSEEGSKKKESVKMSYVLRTLRMKEEVDSIIRDTIDKVLVIRFGRASDSACLILDDIVFFLSSLHTSCCLTVYICNSELNQKEHLIFFLSWKDP